MASKIPITALTQNGMINNTIPSKVKDENDAVLYHKILSYTSLMYNKQKCFVYDKSEKFNVTNQGNNLLRVHTGQANLHGYQCSIDIAVDIPVDSGSAPGHVGYVVLEIDRSLSLDQAKVFALNGDTPTIYPILEKDDIVNTTGIFQMAIASYTIDTVGILSAPVMIDNLDIELLNGQIHPDVMVELESFMTEGSAQSIDVPFRDYISGITLYTTDYDDVADQYNNSDAGTFPLPRRRPITPPIGNSSGGDGDTLFGYQHTLVGSNLSSAYPQPSDAFSTIYVAIDYGTAGDPYPNGISIKGRMDTKNPDRVLAFAVIHYGAVNMTLDENKLQWANHQSYTPAKRIQTLEER